MTAMNRQVLLASRPQGPVTADNFRIVDAPIGEPGAGEVLVKNEWLSLDPYMRGRMNDVKSYVPPVQIGEVMVGQTVGEVVASRIPASPSATRCWRLRAGSSTASPRRTTYTGLTPRVRPHRITSACSACRG